MISIDKFYIVFGVMIICMTAVFYVVMSKTSSLRLATIAALFMGKCFALAMYFLGIDRPLTRLYVYNKHYPWMYKEVVITANIALTMAYATSLVIVVLLPKMSEYIPWLKEVKAR